MKWTILLLTLSFSAFAHDSGYATGTFATEGRGGHQGPVDLFVVETLAGRESDRSTASVEEIHHNDEYALGTFSAR